MRRRSPSAADPSPSAPPLRSAGAVVWSAIAPRGLLAALILAVPWTARGGIRILPENGPGESSMASACGVWSGWWRSSSPVARVAIHVTEDFRVDRVQMPYVNRCAIQSIDHQTRSGAPIENVDGVCTSTIASGQCVPHTSSLEIVFTIRFFPGDARTPSSGSFDCTIQSSWGEAFCQECRVFDDVSVPVEALAWGRVKSLYR